MTIRSPIQYLRTTFTAWPSLWLLTMLMSGCSTAELIQRSVDESAVGYYRYIHVNITLSDAKDTAYVTRSFMKELERHGLQAPDDLNQDGFGIALLMIEELDRHTETVVHRRNLGRTSLTMMRGRELRDRPVISIRATLIDTQSGQAVFLADYVTRGPWYTDSSEIVGAMVDALVGELEREGFIAP